MSTVISSVADIDWSSLTHECTILFFIYFFASGEKKRKKKNTKKKKKEGTKMKIKNIRKK